MRLDHCFPPTCKNEFTTLASELSLRTLLPQFKGNERQKRLNIMYKIRKLCIVVESSIKTKSHSIEWKNIFANHTSNKQLIFKIYKNLIGLKKMNTISLIKTWAEDPNTYLFQERHTDGHQAHERHHFSLGKCKSKSQWDATSHYETMPVSPKTSMGEDVKKNDILYTVCWNIILPLWNTVWSFS